VTPAAGDCRRGQRSLSVPALNHHDVRYVVIGGMGALLHKAPLPPTKDIDITPADNRENLTRLAAALRDLDATLRVEGFVDGVEMTNMTFFPRHGPVLGFDEDRNEN
jgi:hypothetical protein